MNQAKRTIKIIPALDVTELEMVENLVRRIGDSKHVYGFKLGFSIGLTYGLPRAVEVIRRHSDKPIIYDHQKAATDIPDTGVLFGKTLANAGIDEAILFPQAGPETLKGWIRGLRDAGLKIIVGGLMTHKAYKVSEGGFLTDMGIEKIYSDAVENGVNAFVVPLTKPDAVRGLTDSVSFKKDAEFYSPGYGSQGGNPADFDFIARHYLIVGRSLLKAESPEEWLAETMKSISGE